MDRSCSAATGPASRAVGRYRGSARFKPTVSNQSGNSPSISRGELGSHELAGSRSMVRVRTQSAPECDNCCEGDSGGIVAGELVVSCRDTAEVLQAAEHGLGAPAILVALLVVTDRALAGSRAGDDRHDAGFAQVGAEPVGVIALVGQKAPDAARGDRQDIGRCPYVARVARGEMDDGRAAECVGQDVDFGGRAPPRWADDLVFRPPLPPWAQRCALM